MSDSPESTLDTCQKKKDNPQPRPTPPPQSSNTIDPSPPTTYSSSFQAQGTKRTILSTPPIHHAGTQARTRRSQHISCFITLFFFFFFCTAPAPMQPPKLCSASAACTDKPPALAQPACAPGIRNVSRSVCAWTSVVGRWHGTGSKQGEGLGREKANCCCCAAAFLQCSCPL